ncbi:glycoside hydrolase family 2 TIM barrel-domain containing protein [Sporosarcina sp. G11-34]|uniref:glycoside hydrolase family 2 TIM barrel-domain containing protein n=1 Tax=Sporosarcina sp. G11-34 TaxID=2849605 RepID=UPI0022A9AA20|nr:glycoside hydrolase family 2 TIM barrel-domain containing protein [Sporosarcina sp. G11-34]MCZ2258592.1 discoidin domain-containing protein [Sporosarcina sp. G11-34]
MQKIKKVVVLLLIVFLVAGNGSPYVVSAEEEDYSISSPETFIYNTDLSENKRRQLFNDNWKFFYGEQSNAQFNAYDDSKWDDVQLPHDYSLSLPYSQAGEAESGYKLGGIGWYRKSFTLGEAIKDKRVVVEFGGVYMNASVYINGHKLGDHPNGYTPFAYDLTDYINYDEENVISVRVNHQFPSSRWYSGSGIYRNVHLTITDDVHVDHYGVQVLTPNLENQIGKDIDVVANAKIMNQSSEDVNAIVKQSIREKGSEEHIVSEQSDLLKINANNSVPSIVSLKMPNPTLWSLSNPHLYEIVTEVIVEDKVIDEYVTDYGFRTIEFKADTGFYLNGEAVKLKGVSMHSDQGSLGAAAHYRAMERQVEILLDMGVNAIRVTHNPAADELIEIANRKGMLIIDEAFDTWIGSKNGNYNDYAKWFKESVGDNPLLGATADMTWAELDIKTMVRRGINAPSIINWSTGNEVMEGNSGPYNEYPAILEQLATWVVEVDQTRPATIGDNKFKANWKESVSFGNKLTDLGGTVGFNYADGHQFDQFHKNYPEWKMYGAETASSINSRGVYKPSNYNKHLTSYDESAVGWGKLSADSWYSIITRDFMAGEFVWTGFDYLGEPTPWNNVGPGATGGWPSPKSSYFGIVDTAGLPKDRFYFYQSQWNEEVNTLHVLPAWKEDMVNIDDKGNVRVDVYSDASSVELFFKNAKGEEQSLGKKTFTQYTTDAGHTYQVYEGDDKKGQDFRNLYLTWDVPYADGTVYAKAYDQNDNVITNTEGRDSVTTFKEASELKLKADRDSIVANGRDLSYITIDVFDKNGDIVEDAANLINVSVSGDGELIALDNGDQVDHEPYDSGKRKVFNGKLVAIVKSTTDAGTMTLHVESEGIKGQNITISTTPDPEVPTEKHVIGYTMPKNYYVKLGYQPNLVSKTKLLFSDGTEETLPITWDIEGTIFDEPGTVNVIGQVDKYNHRVLTNVTVIESVGALLNYSLATPTGSDNVNLPSSRPLVLENGDVLQTEFPVEWDTQDAENYKKPGLVTVNGTSTVFGETIPVTASVRVNDAEVTLGDNVADNKLTLTQDIPKELQSDNLESIIDGNTGFETVQSGPNPSVWTNYNMAQTGHSKAEIIFTYATAQFLGSADLYFYQDAWAARLPENVELFWSNEGTEDANWTKLENVIETRGETSDGTPNITKINYRFNGVPAVAFKIVLTSDPGTNSAGKKLAVGLSEVELRVEHSSLKINAEATLGDILLNGNSVSPKELKDKVINTEYQKAVVETVSDKNVAVTVLKPYENVIRIITESEDHLTREIYTINLDGNAPDTNLPADDDSRDYPYEKTTATAGDYHKNHAIEGDPKFAVDNKISTIFHTPWGGTDKSNFWITLEMEEVTEIDALRYLSRSGSSNGIVNEYKVEVSLDNETWEEVSVGNWQSKTDTWSIAKFDEPKEGKFVRLTALSTYGDGGQANRFMTAKEIRLRKVAAAKESLESAEVTLNQDLFLYDGKAKTPKATVTLDSIVLEEGIDYRVTYENNVEAGEAKIIIKGLVKYEGTLEKIFIILDKTELVSLISEAKQLNPKDYSEDSVKFVNEAIKAAEEALEKATTQAELDEALTNLEEAIGNLETIETVEASAVVNQLRGNQNELVITIDEVYADDTGSRMFTETILIKNNAEGIYRVGRYDVFVNTKGNTKVLEIYIVE